MIILMLWGMLPAAVAVDNNNDDDDDDERIHVFWHRTSQQVGFRCHSMFIYTAAEGSGSWFG